MQETE